VYRVTRPTRAAATATAHNVGGLNAERSCRIRHRLIADAVANAMPAGTAMFRVSSVVAA